MKSDLWTVTKQVRDQYFFWGGGQSQDMLFVVGEPLKPPHQCTRDRKRRRGTVFAVSYVIHRHVISLLRYLKTNHRLKLREASRHRKKDGVGESLIDI